MKEKETSRKIRPSSPNGEETHADHGPRGRETQSYTRALSTIYFFLPSPSPCIVRLLVKYSERR